MAKELLWNDCLPPLTQQWGQKQPRPGMWGRLEGTIAWISGPLGWAHQNTATVLNVPVGGLGPLCLGYLRQIQHDLPLPVQRAPEEKSASSFPGVSSICALSNHSISSHPYKCVASHMPGPSILGGWPCSSYNETAEVQNSPSYLGKTPGAWPLSQARLRLPSGSLGQPRAECRGDRALRCVTQAEACKSIWSVLNLCKMKQKLLQLPDRCMFLLFQKKLRRSKINLKIKQRKKTKISGFKYKFKSKPS